MLSLAVNENISKTCSLLRPETVWLVLNNSLAHTSIISSSVTLVKRESTLREIVNNLGFCWLISLVKPKESLTV